MELTRRTLTSSTFYSWLIVDSALTIYRVNPAVTSETVKPHRHEETREAIDKEIHQDHYRKLFPPETTARTHTA